MQGINCQYLDVMLAFTFVLMQIICQFDGIIRLKSLWRSNGGELGPTKAVGTECMAPLTCDEFGEQKR